MRRGGILYPPRPRAPAATRQAPPFLRIEGQVFQTDSCNFLNQTRDFGGSKVSPGRKEGQGRDGRHCSETQRNQRRGQRTAAVPGRG